MALKHGYFVPSLWAAVAKCIMVRVRGRGGLLASWQPGSTGKKEEAKVLISLQAHLQ